MHSHETLRCTEGVCADRASAIDAFAKQKISVHYLNNFRPLRACNMKSSMCNSVLKFVGCLTSIANALWGCNISEPYPLPA